MLKLNIKKPLYNFLFWSLLSLLTPFCQNSSKPEEIHPEGITFHHTFGTNGSDLAHMSQQTSDSGYITVGFSASEPIGGKYGAHLLKTDVYGNEKWSKTYSFGSYTSGKCVLITDNTGLIVAGDTYVSDSAGNFFLLKTDSDGNEEWKKVFGTDGNEECFGICKTSDNGYVITGFTTYPTEEFNVYLVKTDEFGNKEWENAYGGDSVDWGYSVAQTADEGYLIVGKTRSFGAGKYDILIVKTDRNGLEEWSDTYGGMYYDEAFSIWPTTDDGYVVTGYSMVEDGGDYRVILLKLNCLGKEEWFKTITGQGYAIGRSIKECIDGGFIIAGENFVTNNNENAILLKTDQDGAILWSKSFGGIDTDIAESVLQTFDNGYLLTGRTYNKEKGVFDFLLVKTDRNGLVDYGISASY